MLEQKSFVPHTLEYCYCILRCRLYCSIHASKDIALVDKRVCEINYETYYKKHRGTKEEPLYMSIDHLLRDRVCSEFVDWKGHPWNRP